LAFVREAQGFILVAFDPKLRHLEPPKQSGRALDAEAPRLLQPVPHGVAALVVLHAPRGTRDPGAYDAYLRGSFYLGQREFGGRSRDNIDAAIKAISTQRVIDLRTEQPSLEDVFLAYYTTARDKEPTAKEAPAHAAS